MSVEKQCACGIDAKENQPVKDCDCGVTQDKAAVNCGCGAERGEAESECGCAPKSEQQRGKLHPIEAPRIYRERRPVKGEVVTVIDATFSSAGIDLSDAWSRAVPRGDVHEIMLWDPVAEEGHDAAAVAFIEITQGGNIINGDEFRVDGEEVGNLAGFDYNHMPNHMNIVIEAKSLKPSIKLGSTVEFAPNPMLDPYNGCC